MRRLNDGREYRIVKIFYDAATLTERLRTIGWEADLESTATYFVYGSASPR